MENVVPELDRDKLLYIPPNIYGPLVSNVAVNVQSFLLIPLGTNMSVLWNFSSSIMNILGQEQFVPVCKSAGVIPSFVSYVWKVTTGR